MKYESVKIKFEDASRSKNALEHENKQLLTQIREIDSLKLEVSQKESTLNRERMDWEEEKNRFAGM